MSGGRERALEGGEPQGEKGIHRRALKGDKEYP